MSTVLKRFSLVGVAVALLATGCGTGPAKAGSAAIVGGQAIELKTVQDRTTTVLKKEPAAQQMQDQGKLGDVSRFVLGDEIRHKMIEHAAQRENITVDETKVYDAIQERGGPEAASQQSEQDASTIHRYIRDLLVASELARRNITTLEVTIDFFQTKSITEAKEKAAEVAADAAKMDEFIQGAGRNTSGAQQSAKNQKVRVSETPSLVTSPLWAAKPGTVVAFQLGEQEATSIVALVRDRRSVAPTPGEDNIVDSVDPQLLATFGQRIAQYLAADLSIEINPRYGVWDPVKNAMSPNKGELGGYFGPTTTKNKS
ncbi:hypothetical protein [Lentzea sp. NPDC051838]|uniref:hypothetical protein n=1 Tax=Lentzea sp. NPDC051838 TaxID=3154849 RepID=UPI0034401C67